MNVQAHLPLVGEYFEQFEKLKVEFNKKCTEDIQTDKERTELGNNSLDMIRDLRFTINTTKAEIE